MKQTRTLTMMFACFFLMLVSSCEKKDDIKIEDHTATKKEWLTGTWKQKDIQLGVTTRVSGITLTYGSSMITDPTLNFLLNQVTGGQGNPFRFTVNNTYTFSSNGSYTVEGFTDLTQPGIGTSGNWDLDTYGSVLAFYPSGGVDKLPNWIGSIRPEEVTLALTVNLPGLGNVPLNLILTKQ